MVAHVVELPSAFHVFPALAKDHWGLGHFGANYGLLFSAWGVGGLVLPRVSQMLVAGAGGADGKYTTSFAMAGLLLLGAAALTFLLRARQPAPRRSSRPPRHGALPLGTSIRAPR